MNRKKLIYAVLSLGTSAAVFAWLLQHVSPGDVLQLLREVNGKVLLMFLVLSLAAAVLRTWRYQMLMSVSGFRASSVALFLVVLVRNFTSDLLPARVGGAVYIYLVNARLGLPLAPAISSFVLAFIFDVMALAPLMLSAVFFAANVNLLYIAAAACLAGAAALVTLAALPRILRILSGRFKRPWLAKAEEEAAKIQKARIYGRVFVLSILIRLAKYAGLYVFLYALLQPLGYTVATLRPSLVFLGIAAAEGAASLPVSGIAGFGAYEGAFAAVFMFLGYPAEIAKLASISHHLFTQLYGYSLGCAALLILLLPFWQRRKNVHISGGTSMLFFMKRLAQFSIIVPALLWGAYEVPLSAAPATGVSEAASAHDKQAIERISAELGEGAKIVFDSNRSGSFGIFALDPSDLSIRPVIDSPEHEMYPDPSPGGEWIAFARSTSLLRSAPSDIWLVRPDGSEARRLVPNGTFPTFSSDGKYLFFERGRKKIMRIEIDGGAVQEVFPRTSGEFAGFEIVKPRVSPGGRHAAFISDRKGAWNTWYADLSTLNSVHLGQGCEPAWFSDGKRLAWVRGVDTSAGSGIYMFDRERRDVSVLEDDGPPRGHEYFPTISGGDRFLLYSAAGAKEHSHTSANYQLYMKLLRDGTKARLTHDGFTNRWPKILVPAAPFR